MKLKTKIIMLLFFGIVWAQENPTIMRGDTIKFLKGRIKYSKKMYRLM